MKPYKKFFTVRAMSVEDEQKAMVLEALINRPSVVSAIMAKVEEQVKANLDEIILGYKAEDR